MQYIKNIPFIVSGIIIITVSALIIHYFWNLESTQTTLLSQQQTIIGQLNVDTSLINQITSPQATPTKK